MHTANTNTANVMHSITLLNGKFELLTHAQVSEENVNTYKGTFVVRVFNEQLEDTTLLGTFSSAGEIIAYAKRNFNALNKHYCVELLEL